ncbi:MAG: glycosyltransferase family 4 protein [Thermonemataceae bacterium]|nr:glycosyltransferase family 4 protein [Thermonemataceae bacterium]
MKKITQHKKILFLFPYPSGTAGSQRFRFEQYLGFLEEAGFCYSLRPFLDEATWQILYKNGYTIKKVKGIIKGFLKRFFLLFTIAKYDYIFLHREATPLGYPWLEFWITKVWKKKLIYDFDDAIWLPNTSEQNKWVAWLKYHQKVALICKWAYKISAGNNYLAQYAKQFNDKVFVNPTTIDTENWHNPVLVNREKRIKPIIGWTGTHSTIPYLDFLLPILRNLATKKDFTFLVISDKKPDFSLSNLEFITWNKDTEIQDLAKMDIGVMPLEDDPWAKGKCGFKALQYMAMGIIPVVSPVGVNTEIVKNGENGFLTEREEEWSNILEKLLNEDSLRQTLGQNARETVKKSYSVSSNQTNFLGFFA